MAISIKRIAEHFDLPRSDAKAIRDAMDDPNRGPDDVLDLVNTLTNAHGIEAIRGDMWVNSYYGDIVGLYVNMGDTYAATIVYDTPADRWYLTDYGTWVEKRTRSYRIY